MTLRYQRTILAFLILLLLLGSLSAGLLAAVNPEADAASTIANQQATNDAANVYYQFNYTGNYQFYRVYSDTDQNPATGLQSNGIGANYLLENGSLYAYSGTGTNWSWRFIKNVTYANASSQAKWSVARSDIGEAATPNQADLIFQVELRPTIVSTAKYAHVYSGISTPPVVPPATATVTVTYSPTSALFANPERGFYRYFESRSSNFESDQPDIWTVADLQNTNAVDWLEAPEEATITQIYCLFYLDTFLHSDISTTFLDHIRANFTAIRNAGRKCILRFAYTWDNTDEKGAKDANGNDIGDDIPDILQDANRDTEPDLPQLLAHISQLKPILQDYSDVIAVLQAGFIGIWGEWYYTDHFVDTPSRPSEISPAQYDRRKQVVLGLLDALPITRTIALRTPQLKKMMFGRTTPITRAEAFKNTPIARIGFHNDAFLNSYGDSGTFESDADRTYLQAESLYLNMGGEVNSPESGAPPRACADALRDMGKYHWSYINTDYHIPTLQSWKKGGCIHNVSNIAGSILDRLGYRFVLKRGIYPTTAKPGGKLAVRIELTNEGFAAPYNKRSVYLVLRNTSTNINSYSALLPDDPRLWLAGQTHVISRTVTLPTTLPVGNYALYLHLADPATTLRNLPVYAIRLANANLWPATNWNGMNNLRHTVTVSNTAVSAASAMQNESDAEGEDILIAWEEIDIVWTEEDSSAPDSPEESAPDESGAVAEIPTTGHNLFLPIVAQK